MEFTKRNNACRHVSNQHNIKNTGLGKHGFVCKIGEEEADGSGDEDSQVSTDNDEVGCYGFVVVVGGTFV